jgi:predicted GNAT family N-acyltransferase
MQTGSRTTAHDWREHKQRGTAIARNVKSNKVTTNVVHGITVCESAERKSKPARQIVVIQQSELVVTQQTERIQDASNSHLMATYQYNIFSKAGIAYPDPEYAVQP